MNTALNPLRWLAVACSVVLAGGFVAYRAGWLNGSTAQAAAPKGGDRVMLSSSKSGAIVPPGSPPATSSQPAAKPRAVMSGSKSLIITSQETPTSQPAPPAPKAGK